MGCANIEDVINLLKFLFGKCNGKKPFRRPGHRWENITKDVIEIGVKMSIGLQRRSHEHCNKPSDYISGR
jgi:hypothetical protein